MAADSMLTQGVLSIVLNENPLLPRPFFETEKGKALVATAGIGGQNITVTVQNGTTVASGAAAPRRKRDLSPVTVG